MERATSSKVRFLSLSSFLSSSSLTSAEPRLGFGSLGFSFPLNLPSRLMTLRACLGEHSSSSHISRITFSVMSEFSSRICSSSSSNFSSVSRSALDFSSSTSFKMSRIVLAKYCFAACSFLSSALRPLSEFSFFLYCSSSSETSLSF